MSAIPGFLTAEEAAVVIGVSHAQVTRYVKDGKLPAKKVGQVILIDETDAKSFCRPPRGNPNFLNAAKV